MKLSILRNWRAGAIALGLFLGGVAVAVAVNAPTYRDAGGVLQPAAGVAIVNGDSSFADFSTGVAVKSAQRTTTTATISNGTSLSAGVDLSAGTLTRIVIPASWTTANLTFQTSSDNSTWNNLYDAYGNEYTVTVTGGSTAILVQNPGDFLGVRYLKIRSGTSGSAVNQGADRVLTLVLVP